MRKIGLMAMTLMLSSIFALTVAGCGGDEDNSTEWKLDTTVSATCGNPGMEIYKNKEGETKTVKTSSAATGNHNYDGHVCTVCGYVDMSDLTEEEAIAQYGYYHIDNDESHTVNVNDSIFFGSYPQKKITDETLINTLNSSLSASGWTSYGYYVSGSADNIMSWQDVTEAGTKYRAVKIDAYRPGKTDGTSDSNWMGMSSLNTGSVYFYEYSPIEWRVLDYVNGEAFLNSVKNLDSQPFKNSYVKDGVIYYADESKTSYANDWEYSDIRSWLNGIFTNWAFSSEEQARLVEQTLNNNKTGYSETMTFSVNQKDTKDKVYLLSYSDILNSDYGFPAAVTNTSASSINDPSVCKVSTAYSESQGIRKSMTELNADGEGCSWWMLRSAGGKSFSICGINKYGTISKSATTAITDDDAVVNNTNSGISPAINIKIGK